MSSPATLQSKQQLFFDGMRTERHLANTMTRIPVPGMLQQKILTHSRTQPDRPAVLSINGEFLTYERLVGEARYVQGVLASVGVWPADVVATLLPDGPASVPVMLGTSGCCVFAPLNRRAPQPEITRTLKRLRPKAVFCDRSSAALVKANGALPLILGEDGISCSLKVDGYDSSVALTNLQCPSSGEDIAFILQTSGTTGEARGVLMPHRMIVYAAQRFQDVYRLTPEDRSLVVTPLTHTLGLFAGVVAMLYAGASAVVTPGYDSGHFADWWRSTEPTVFSAVPAIFQSIADTCERTGAKLRQPRLVRHAACPIPERVKSQAEAIFERPLHQMYAMTEAIGMFGTPYGEASPPGSCGKVFCGEARIADPDGRAVEAGEKGEVQVRGAHVAPGYHNDPSATAGMFQDGWLRSGDEGYMDREGHLFLTGRFTDVINRGGESVMPLEVDQVLSSHPLVKEALTFSVPCDRVGEEIAAIVVLQTPGAVRSEDLQDFAAARLSEFKVPRQIEFFDTLPRNANGKPDRKAGRALLTNNRPMETSATYAEPRVRAIWQDVLRVPVSRHDRFVDCGGTSLQAAAMLQRVALEFGLQHLSPTLLWRAPTLATFAAAVERAAGQKADLFDIDLSGKGRPVIWIAPDFSHRHLWDSLRGWRPIHGVTLPQDLWTVGSPTIVRAAAHCARAICDRMGESGAAEVTLIGWCSSGVVAFETARQLRQCTPSGSDGPGVIIIDGHDLLTHPDWGMAARWSRLVSKVRFKALQLARLGTGGAARFAMSRISTGGGSIAGPGVTAAIRHAVRSYRPASPYSGPLFHILATERPMGRYRHPETVWGRHAGGPHGWADVPGNHNTMFLPPNVEGLAVALRGNQIP